MSITRETNGATERPPFLPLRTPEQAREWGDRLIAAVGRIKADPDIEDQEETLAVLRAAGLVAPEGGRKP